MEALASKVACRLENDHWRGTDGGRTGTFSEARRPAVKGNGTLLVLEMRGPWACPVFKAMLQINLSANGCPPDAMLMIPVHERTRS